MLVTRKKTVYQLAFMPRFFPVNCYLVDEEDGLTLVDAALPYSTKGILQTAKQIGKPITRIVLTHAHTDHVGALDNLKEQLPDVPVYISARDSRLMAGDKSLDSNEPDTPIKGGVPKGLKTRADVLLNEGDEVGSLVAINTPGHTPGHMAFLDQRNQAIIAGDAMQTKGGVAVSGQFKPLFPFPAMATWNKELAIESVQKLFDYNPSLLAIGHGKMIENPNKIISSAIQHAEQKIS